jgi:predicted ATPase
MTADAATRYCSSHQLDSEGDLVASVDGAHFGVAGGLVGRDGEIQLLVSFLDRAAQDGAALLVLGDPGVGKTALLDAAAGTAARAGARVLRAAGVQFEAELTFSGLHQTLLPLHDELGQLGAPDRDALNVALGFGAGPAPDQLVVSNATLHILRQAARARPVLLVVDDLPWLDRTSATILGVVARRLSGSRVGFLGAAQTGRTASSSAPASRPWSWDRSTKPRPGN